MLVVAFARGGHEISICPAFVENRLGDLARQIQGIRLGVLFIRGKLEPLESVEDGIERLLRIALNVRIVDAQNHRAVVMACIQPVENECSRTADVKISGWRGSE